MPTPFRDLVRIGFRGLPSIIALCAATACGAETVSLRSVDGSFVLTGKVALQDDGLYVLDGPLGELRIGADRVTCEGSKCPTTSTMEVAAVAAPQVAETANGATPVRSSQGSTSGQETVQASVARKDLAESLLGGFARVQGIVTTVEWVSGLGYQIDLGQDRLVVATGPNALEAVASGAANFAIIVGSLPELATTNGLRVDLLGHDAVAVVSHPSNPVDQLGLQEIQEIFTGKITNWSAISGPDAPITSIIEADASGIAKAIESAALAGIATDAATTIRSLTRADAVRLVAQDPTAVALVRHTADADARTVAIVDQCGFRATPDPVTLASRAYPLELPILLVSRSDSAAEVGQSFVEYAMSASSDPAFAAAQLGDRAIRAVSLEDRITAIPTVEGTGRTARLTADLRGDAAIHDRLSIAFRFAFGSSKVDPALDPDVDRLVDALAGLPTGTRIKVVGFSDEVGTSRTNRSVSVERARSVAAALRDRGGERLATLDITAVGYGDLMPIACNDNETGRAMNRRVEIWVPVAPEAVPQRTPVADGTTG